ncbi:hypothetical protein Zmor_024497 [Zophobas morio]|uniref:Tetraspanin n=1 Tax=Zophobas morio TaxID=2755281 RepID=A0AA38M7S3_9CUCU|nr:hypothetical protein Zmor_024497 [Zophobas morio]
MNDGKLLMIIIALVLLSINLIIVGSEVLKDEEKGIERFTNSSGALAIIVGFSSFLTIVCLPGGTYVTKTIYFIFLFIVFIMELVLSGLALAAVSDNNDISRIMKLVFDSYAQNQTYTNKLSVDTIQHHLRCCGFDGPQYWTSLGFKEYPDSCYQDPLTKKNLHSVGCLGSFRGRMMPKITVIGVLALLLGLIKNFVVSWIVITDKVAYQQFLFVIVATVFLVYEYRRSH